MHLDIVLFVKYRFIFKSTKCITVFTCFLTHKKYQRYWVKFLMLKIAELIVKKVWALTFSPLPFPKSERKGLGEITGLGWK